MRYSIFFKLKITLKQIIKNHNEVFPLHTKTALLASLISFLVLIVGLVVVIANTAKQIQSEQKEFAALQAENFAEQLSLTQDNFDAEGLRNLANVLSGSRPNLVTVRV